MSTLPTEPTKSRSQPPPPTPCPIAALLQEDRRKIHWLPPDGEHLVIGRSTSGDVRIDDRRISREHAFIERRPDRIVVRARRRVRADSEDIAEVELWPGDRFVLRCVGFTALTAPQARAYPDLDRLVGDPQTVRDLLIMPRGRHAFLHGVRGAPLFEIAEHQHAAIAGPSADLWKARLGRSGDPDAPDVESLLPMTVNGRIFIDGRKRNEKGRAFAPHLARPFLDRLGHPEQRTALTIALHDLSDVDTNVLRPGCANFLIAPITSRLSSKGPFDRDYLIDKTLEHVQSPLRVRHLHPDFIAALEKCPWTGDYAAFRSVLLFALRAWRGEFDWAALTKEQSRRLTMWLNEAALSEERIRELRPDTSRFVVESNQPSWPRARVPDTSF